MRKEPEKGLNCEKRGREGGRGGCVEREKRKDGKAKGEGGGEGRARAKKRRGVRQQTAANV